MADWLVSKRMMEGEVACLKEEEEVALPVREAGVAACLPYLAVYFLVLSLTAEGEEEVLRPLLTVEEVAVAQMIWQTEEEGEAVLVLLLTVGEGEGATARKASQELSLVEVYLGAGEVVTSEPLP